MKYERPEMLAAWEFELLTAIDSPYEVLKKHHEAWVDASPSKSYASLFDYVGRLEEELEQVRQDLEEARKEVAYENQSYKYLHQLYLRVQAKVEEE